MTKKPAKAKRVRKPRELDLDYGRFSVVTCKIEGNFIYMGPVSSARMSIFDARELAAWLLKAADYLEAKDKK